MSDTIEKSQSLLSNVWIELKAERLLQNLQMIRESAGLQNEVMAVIKANGYGHGLHQVARTLDGHVLYLGVSSIKEALELKELNLKSRIFLFGRLFRQEIGAVLSSSASELTSQPAANDITLSVSSLTEAEDIASVAQSFNKTAKVHIKIDTGMGRMGIPLDRALADIEKISKMQALEIEGIYSHFPTAETADVFRDQQTRDFNLLAKALELKKIFIRFKHLQNSAACFSFKPQGVNLIRPGLALYGISGEPERKLQPVLALKAKVIHVKRLSPGASAGYGRQFTAEKATTIGVIPVGYSQGYSYAAWKKGQILFQGKRFPLAGRISMDYMTINFGNQYLKPGDTVTLIGEDGGDCITANEVAHWAGTIPYEIITALQYYLPRVTV